MAHFSNSVNLFDFKSVICGFHVYQKIWDLQIDKELMCELMEPSNESNENTVMKDDIIRVHTKIIIFLFLNQSICCGYSK